MWTDSEHGIKNVVKNNVKSGIEVDLSFKWIEKAEEKNGRIREKVNSLGIWLDDCKYKQNKRILSKIRIQEWFWNLMVK